MKEKDFNVKKMYSKERKSIFLNSFGKALAISTIIASLSLASIITVVDLNAYLTMALIVIASSSTIYATYKMNKIYPKRKDNYAEETPRYQTKKVKEEVKPVIKNEEEKEKEILNNILNNWELLDEYTKKLVKYKVKRLSLLRKLAKNSIDKGEMLNYSKEMDEIWAYLSCIDSRYISRKRTKKKNEWI